MSLISILVSPIRKYPWLMSKAYDAYDFVFPKYLSIIKHFSGKYSLERNVNKLKKTIKKKKELIYILKMENLILSL